ncbi:MAG: radical SAM family heme chaperone HemW [Muribaculum sp.]|nr:radical SAM family heme chaperone HemW [Muribaculum sp.]
MTENKKMRELELYLHIPFCIQKCQYCDFLSAPAGRRVQNAYMEALLRELRHNAQETAGCRVVSVFIGGGTPSAVDATWIGRLTEALRQDYPLAEDAEISMEVNPGTVTRESLALYRAAGVNRLSIGCQSADDGELKRIGRIHTFGEFLEAYGWAREAGFSNINTDLISGLPGQTPDGWERTLEAVLSLHPAPEHISAYGLQIEEGTPFDQMRRAGRLELPDEETEREMYWRTAQILRAAGYEHYEISNYARPGFRCLHNCGYWRRREYLGFGVGAASLMDEVRFRNGDALEPYLAAPENCREEIHRLGEAERMEETLFLGLRMADGVDVRAFRETFHREIEEIYGEQIRKSMAEGLLERRGNWLALTMRGVDVSNYVMAGFLLT